jgi:hypothetical protein
MNVLFSNVNLVLTCVLNVIYEKTNAYTYCNTHSVRDYVNNIVLGIRYVGKSVAVKYTVL